MKIGQKRWDRNYKEILIKQENKNDDPKIILNILKNT